MTAAFLSRAERRRAMRSGHLTVLDRPPVFCDLRPLTVAELRPGEAMTPGMQMFTVSGLRDDGTPGELFFEFVVRLPAHQRENTGSNVRSVLEGLRRSPEFCAFMDQYHWFAPKAGEPDECLQRARAKAG